MPNDPPVPNDPLVPTVRLDAALVRRGLARSRRHARAAVEQGRVTVDGRAAVKPSAAVDDTVALSVAADPDDPGYVSRGGDKLAGALTAFAPLGLVVTGRRCLDAGASTGGFTDALLRAGATEVVAVDVGHDQLAQPLRHDPRVHSCEGVNVRRLAPPQVGGAVDAVAADLSFVSLVQVLPSLAALVLPGGDLVVLVKPQFEVGREHLGRGGVVRAPALRAGAVTQVVQAAGRSGLRARAAVPSGLPGPAGNIEFFVWLRRQEDGARLWTSADSDRLVAEPPGSGRVVEPPPGAQGERLCR